MSNVIPLPVWRGQLDMGERGIKRNLTNLMLHVRHLDGLGTNIRFNEVAHTVEWLDRPLEEANLVDIRMIIERAGFQPVDKDVRPAVERVARDNAYNPITDYLDALAWDGKPRLDQWAVRLLGAPDTPFTRAVGTKTLIAAVARARQPGCKVDTVLVLEGAQGLKKSTAIATLFGEPYTAESVSLFDQHAKMVMQMMGAWCVELAEFVAFTRKDNPAVKGMLSMRADRVVLPYAKAASTHPRRCIFFATINPDDFGYLTDATGNRRYWPIKVKRIDMDGIVAARDQLWAEAQHRFSAREPWWLDADTEVTAATETAARAEVDPWLEILADKIARENMRELTPAAAMTLIGIPYERMDRRAQMRAAQCLKTLGFACHVLKRSGQNKRVWTVME